jgi:hypothetical protein
VRGRGPADPLQPAMSHELRCWWRPPLLAASWCCRSCAGARRVTLWAPCAGARRVTLRCVVTTRACSQSGTPTVHDPGVHLAHMRLLLALAATVVLPVSAIAEAICDLTGEWQAVSGDGSSRYDFNQSANGSVVVTFMQTDHRGGRSDPPPQRHLTLAPPAGHWQRCTGTINDYVVSLQTDTGHSLSGQVDGNCSRIPWGTGPAWCRVGSGDCGRSPDPGGAADPESISKVHVVSMCHLDVGFTDTVAGVVNKYWHLYFPMAANTSSYLNTAGKPPQYVFTTHAWLLDMFFDCPSGGFLPVTGTKWPLDLAPHTPCDQFGLGAAACEVGCPSDQLKATVTAAIRAGGITWHAFPSNNEPESGDASLLLGGVDAVHRLDDKFGLPHKVVMSQRDVPGVTRGIVPLLRTRGVVAFSEGANGAFTSPQLPLLFNWTDSASGDSILYLNHPKGYGQDDSEGEAVTATHSGRRRLLSPTDAVSLAGFDEALIFAFRGDNGGPQSVQQARANIAAAQMLFPNAEIVGSSLDAFVLGLLKHGTSALPIVRSEVGDTWIVSTGPSAFYVVRFRCGLLCTEWTVSLSPRISRGADFAAVRP